VKVHDYMSKDVIAANLNDGLRQTFYRMREQQVRHMPVIDDQGILAGIISDRDLRRPDWVDDEENVAHYYLLDNAHLVKDTMTRGPVVIQEGSDISEAADAFVGRRFGALPVVDGEGRMVGMLSQLDVIQAYREHQTG
jgi:acetoin utilization protein AcuB